MDLSIKRKKKTSRIKGLVPISGSKNSSLACICSSLLTDEEVILHNIPNISDVLRLITIIKKMGHTCFFTHNTLFIKRQNNKKYIISDDVDKLRGAIYLIGGYLSIKKKIAIKSFGGCNLGKRPMNYHINGLKRLNVKYSFKNGYHIFKRKSLVGNTIRLEFPSVGATINLLLASVMAKGVTILDNVATEVEVSDVINLLNKMGANIRGISTQRLIITGVKKLHGCEYTIVNDRIEAGTYLALGLLKDNSEVTIKGMKEEYLKSYLNVLKDMGHIIICNDEKQTITALKGDILNPLNIQTGVYPNIPTDLQPIISLLLTQVEGKSTIKETIFENRFSIVSELKKLGCNIHTYNQTIIINGKSTLTGGIVNAYDLRQSAALVLSSVVCNNDLLIKDIDYIFRGYENIEYKLKKLGLNLNFINNEKRGCEKTIHKMKKA